ncbi:hypothetical protein DRP53_03000 [candidate division WOR-3 bacterium]|uniref:Divalent metal cation transporter n=1 Tax=candidate division WOR-3 bacterium TaxID=2052148 RepID=A0A660SJM4_UNCW3|nr:MAG: hypothetical protein DRP53_03000 [candidate division WOR-3 bacterium]
MDKIGRREIRYQAEVPRPKPWKEFMLYIGPVMMTVALGLGTSEIILYPHLTARFGTGWLGLMVIALFLQTVWAMEMARWTVVAGEHGAEFNSRVIGYPLAVILISGFMFIAFAIPAWATAAASALRELLAWPGDPKLGTVFWSYLTFGIVFLIIFFSKVARQYLEHLATWSTGLAWIILIIGAVISIRSTAIGHMARNLIIWEIPEGMDWWVLGSTLAWVGAGPTLIWYTYWMKDAGWGMAQYSVSIPGWFGKETRPEPVGSVPSQNGENISRLKGWIRRSHLVIWLGYFLGSLLTIFIMVGLSDSILRPAGLVPKGFDVVKFQARFFEAPLGQFGISLFLLMAWLFFFNTQATIAEALVRQNADITYRLTGKGIKRIYFTWWFVYLIASFVLIGLQYFVPGASPFTYVLFAAMLSFVSLVVSMGATFFGAIICYRSGILRAVRPSPFWIIALGIGFVIHIYIIIRAVAFRFGV